MGLRLPPLHRHVCMCTGCTNMRFNLATMAHNKHLFNTVASTSPAQAATDGDPHSTRWRPHWPPYSGHDRRQQWSAFAFVAKGPGDPSLGASSGADPDDYEQLAEEQEAAAEQGGGLGRRQQAVCLTHVSCLPYCPRTV
jgi:hypothetical protein